MNAERPTAGSRWRPRWRPRLRHVLLLSNLLILALPIAGLLLVRLYDSMLIRQTESELIAQSAAIAALYTDQLARLSSERGAPLSSYGHLAQADLQPEQHFRPALASLDLARHPVLPQIPPARHPDAAADPLAVALGESLASILTELQRTSLAGLRVIDPLGTVVASSGSELGQSIADRPEVAAALAGYRASVLRRRHSNSQAPSLASISRGTQLRVVVGFPITVGERVVGAVIATRTPMAVGQALYRDRRYFIGGGVLLLITVALLAWITAAALGRPMEALIEQTERVRRGERGAAQPLDRPGTREVARISESVAHMAQALEHRADYIATFAANVSHEFKTPLTSIRGTVELLQDHLGTMRKEELERFLSMLDKDARRLDRLVLQLHELARADVLRPTLEVTPLGPILQTAADVAVKRYAHQKLEAVVDVGAESSVAIGPDILGSMLSNLIDNAAQHDATRITLRTRADGDALRLEVQDNGAGISEANLSKIFDRFFTTRRDAGGSGLGLAIVRSLLEAHGGSIEARSAPGDTSFELVLPVASSN